MKNIVPDYRLDMVGEPCPYPAVATLEAMPQLKKARSSKWSATVRSQLIIFHWTHVTTAIPYWISNKTGRPFVI